MSSQKAPARSTAAQRESGALAGLRSLRSRSTRCAPRSAAVLGWRDATASRRLPFAPCGRSRERRLARRPSSPFQSHPGTAGRQSVAAVSVWCVLSARTARRCRPPLARGSLCSPLASRRSFVAPRFARDRPVRACGRSPHRERPFRARFARVRSLIWSRRQHQARFRLRLAGSTDRNRLVCWPLAPGGSPRGAGCVLLVGRALARAPQGGAKARARARRDVSVGSVSTENRE